MPWAVSCCPFGASLGVRCCSGRHGGVHIGLKGHQLLAQGSALGCTMQGEARPARAKAFALTARKIQRPHKNPGRCPGLLAAAPLGRRWMLVVVRADAGCSHRPERPSATSPGQRPGLYDARGSPPCKGKSFCTYSAKNPTATQKPRAFFPRFALKAAKPSGPGLLAAAPLGRRWVLVVVRADRFATLLSEGLGEVVCPYGWVCLMSRLSCMSF